MLRFLLSLLFLLLICFVSRAQVPERRQGFALRHSQKIKVDGTLDEAAWKEASVMSGFIQLEPDPGKESAKKTEVRVIYDNDAVYIGAALQDHPDSILKELTPRDQLGNTDWFGFFIDAYRDGINGLGFIVTPSGIQADSKYSAFGEDMDWNAVWQSEVTIHKSGWNLEMKIPYSALRFPKSEVQEWHINFIRYSRQIREKATWNPIVPTINGFINQFGKLGGVQGIEPPLRLQLSPYLSSYYIVSGKEKATSLNGGMDIKYGINEAFTLDMTLIPDFGQVQSDNTVLNLSPFEVRFQENRQFFTEGTELFNKGDLFYSRRVGSTNSFLNLRHGQHLTGPTHETRLLNATKISGRTTSGLGLGLFNAVTRPNFATAAENGTEEKVLVEPLTNYNVVVFDQNLPNNSYVTLINTNVARNGVAYDANVTGLEFYVQDKKLRYSLGGSGALSQQFGLNGQDVRGIKHGLTLSKASGNFTANIGYLTRTNTFDPNDLGYLSFNNTIDKFATARYEIYKPFGIFNRAGMTFFINHTNIYKPRAFHNFATGVESFFILRNFDAFGGFFNTEPVVTYDYFEPRTADYSRFYTYPVNHRAGIWLSSDYRKRFAFDLNLSYRIFDEDGRNTLGFDISPRFRVNDHLSFIYTINRQQLNNDVGYAVLNQLGSATYPDREVPQDIIFGIRDQVVYTNILSTKCTFNNRMGITMRLRHYWARVSYQSLHALDSAGFLAPTAYTGRDDEGRSYHDNNFNTFNIDMVYSWVFSPGSELRLVWKNSIFGLEDRTRADFYDNLDYLFAQPQTNSFSFKVLYFLDYSTVVRRKKPATP